VPHTVLALGLAVLTASGCVWYLPAIAELRAGADRPLSTRLAASASLTWWGTAAVLALLLLTTASWQVPVAVAAAGTTSAGVLRIRSLIRRREEQREEARRWAALRCDVPVDGLAGRPQRIFAGWALAGIVLAIVTAAVLLLTGSTAGPARTVTAGSAAVTVSTVFLLIAIARVHAVRRRSTGVGAPQHSSRGSV
jgi:hypothetical protein